MDLHIFDKISPYAIVGLSGIDSSESKRTQQLGRIFNYSLWVVAILLLFQWHEQFYFTQHLKARIMNWFIWLYFLTSFITLTTAVKNKVHYVASNWLFPTIIILGLPTLLSPNYIASRLAEFRPFLALYILVPSLSLLWHFFIDGKLRTTLIAAAVIVVIFGLLISSVDPAIHSFWDGIWWAIATISTVGYGDVVPVSAFGRVIGGVLIIMGIGIFVVITANFLAIILHKRKDDVLSKLLTLEKSIRKLDKTQQQLLRYLGGDELELDDERQDQAKAKSQQSKDRGSGEKPPS